MPASYTGSHRGHDRTSPEETSNHPRVHLSCWRPQQMYCTHTLSDVGCMVWGIQVLDHLVMERCSSCRWLHTLRGAFPWTARA